MYISKFKIIIKILKMKASSSGVLKLLYEYDHNDTHKSISFIA